MKPFNPIKHTLPVMLFGAYLLLSPNGVQAKNALILPPPGSGIKVTTQYSFPECNNQTCDIALIAAKGSTPTSTSSIASSIKGVQKGQMMTLINADHKIDMPYQKLSILNSSPTTPPKCVSKAIFATLTGCSSASTSENRAFTSTQLPK